MQGYDEVRANLKTVFLLLRNTNRYAIDWVYMQSSLRWGLWFKVVCSKMEHTTLNHF